MKSLLDVAMLGQVFTPPSVVDLMIGLRKNVGRTLEPSAGNGAFFSRIAGCEGIEIDPRVAPAGANVMDFFDLPLTETFETIIGNPPYVRYQDIALSTREKLDHSLFDRRSNLFLFFIEKCIQHLRPGGELIFIVPRELSKLTSARKLNEFIFDQGSITDYIETGDAKIFSGATPNCVIFRFEKGLICRAMTDGRRFDVRNGQLFCDKRESSGLALGDLFDVKVGAVSGADEVFAHPDGNEEFVCSTTIDTGAPRRMIYGSPHPLLLPHKERLLARRIRRFDDNNWWEWGRQHHKSQGPRIYVNAKTRRTKPFFTHPCLNYDGSILAMFPKSPTINIDRATEALNNIDWGELGFLCDGRHLFSQRSLQTVVAPAFSSLMHL